MASTIKRGAHVESTDGEIGRVQHVVVEPDTHEVTHIIVKNDLGERLFPIGEVDAVDGDRITLRGSQSSYLSLPRFNREAYHPVNTRRVEDEQHEAVHGGAPLLDAAGDEVVIGRPGVDVVGSRSFTAGEDDEHVTAAADSPYRLQLRRERLRAETQSERAGAVLVRREVRERTERVEVPVREEWLVIERRPGSGRVWLGDRELGEGETVELPLLRERVVVQKEPLATEDVVISKKLQVRNEQVEGTVREEQLTVDDPLGAAEMQPEAPYCPLPGREGPTPAPATPAPVAPSPLGYYRPEGPAPAAPTAETDGGAGAETATHDNEPTERLLRPERYQTHMYDPEPHPATYPGMVPGTESVPMMPPLDGCSHTEDIEMAENEINRTPPAPGEDVLASAPHGGSTRFGPEVGKPDEPAAMEPYEDASNLRATYVPDSSKPAASGEYNPGGGEYAGRPAKGPAGTEVAVGGPGSHPDLGSQKADAKLPPRDYTPESPHSAGSE